MDATGPVQSNEGVNFDRPCVGCGYNLRGLRMDGACPECGKPVADSLRGHLLRFASAEYVESLHRGVFLVLTAIILQIVTAIAGFLLVMAAVVFMAGPGAGPGGGGGGGAGGGPASSALGGLFGSVELLAGGISTSLNFLLLYGWWKLSEPDPGYVGRDDGAQSRRWLRILVVIQAVGALFGFVMSLVVPQAVQVIIGALGAFGGGAGPGGGGAGPGGVAVATGLTFAVIAVLVSIAAGMAWIAAFFFQMVYIRWLAARVPDNWVANRAKLLMWLAPVLYVVGSLCLALGPLVALILYWNMLDRLRKDLKTVRQTRGELPA